MCVQYETNWNIVQFQMYIIFNNDDYDVLSVLNINDISMIYVNHCSFE